MGFCVQRVSYTWVFWTLAIVNAIQLALYIPLGPETRYIPFQDRRKSAVKRQYAWFHRIDPIPWKFTQFIEPLFLARHANVLLPSFGHGVIFMFTSVYLTILLPRKESYNPVPTIHLLTSRCRGLSACLPLQSPTTRSSIPGVDHWHNPGRALCRARLRLVDEATSCENRYPAASLLQTLAVMARICHTRHRDCRLQRTVC